MRTISPAMLAHLQSDVRTVTTLCKITRTDGAVFGFTDLDRDVTYNGLTYSTTGGYTHSAIDASNNLSTSNLEITALFENGVISAADIEAGLWSNAAVLIFLVNYADLSMGQVNLSSGNLGQFVLQNGTWQVEIRGLAQTMQQSAGDQFSPTCRATFGDSKCTLSLAALTFSGTVSSIVTPSLAWNDPSLTQAGPVVPFTDTMGKRVPTTGPYTIQIVPPSGSFVAIASVVDGGAVVFSKVASNPGSNQYTVDANGLMTFNASQGGWEVFIGYTYAVGYFTYGKVTWTSGQNKGYSMEVVSSAPGLVTLALPMPSPIAAGDTYTIVAGCDKQFGTCRDRYNNIVHFRGEPYIPGPDVLLAPIGS